MCQAWLRSEHFTCVLTHTTFTTAPAGGYCCQLPVHGSEAQGGEAACPGPVSEEVMECSSNPGSLAPASVFIHSTKLPLPITSTGETVSGHLVTLSRPQIHYIPARELPEGWSSPLAAQQTLCLLTRETTDTSVRLPVD